MTPIGAPRMASFTPPPTEPSELALRERVFSECVWHFKGGLAERILRDLELKSSSEQFLQNATEQFQMCVKMDEQTSEAHNEWANEVSVQLGIHEERHNMNYNISFHFIRVFNSFLAMMHPQGEMAQVSDTDESNKGAKELLAKFEADLRYLQRLNYDAQGAIDCWDSPLAIKEEEFKKAQMKATIWSTLQTLPTQTAEQFETVYNLLKLLQSVYKTFECNDTSIYRLKYLTSAIRFMALLIRGELGVVRDSAETDRAVRDLVSILTDMVHLWKNNSLKTNGVIHRLQEYVKQMESNGKLCTRHLAINCFIFMLSSLNMFQQPRSQNKTDENLRGHKVLRVRLKRVDCFSDTGYQLIEFWQHIMETKAVNLRGAYFVLDHQSNDKKGKKDDQSDDKKGKNAERKIAGLLLYFIGETDEDALMLQKLHIAWMRSRKERERVFNEVCPTLAVLQSDGLSEAQDSERRLARQFILRKKNSLVLDPKTDAEKKAFQKDEELQEYLCTSDDWSGPAGEFDTKWLESIVGGSWSMAEEKKRDPGKLEENIWFEQILEAQKQTLHIFYALQKNKTSSDGSNHQDAKRASNGKNKKQSSRKRTLKRYSPRVSASKRAYGC